MTAAKKLPLLAALERRRGEMVRTIRHLVEQESPSFNKPAVDLFAQSLAKTFAGIGARVRLHPTREFGEHLQADFAADSRAQPVLLLGHMDTVWDVGTLKMMPARERNGRLYGPGVYDMKAGIAQMIFAVDALQQLLGALPRPVTVLLVSDEEVKSASSRALLTRLAKQSAAVFVLEPSAGVKGSLKTARKGVGEYQVKVTGISSHAGLDPQNGHSAIIELARQIERIAAFTDMKRGITVNPGIIRGGTRTNVVAAQAEVEVDARIARLADAQRLERKFRGLRPFDKACRLQVTGGINRPPLERTPKVVALFRHAQAAARELGFEVGEASVGGGSDGNFTAALGIPTLDGLGAVGEGAHAINESIVISELPRRTALLARLIEIV
ncbi:MAG TPA: M20 family metallopeptidase [Terriglobales bacterium]|nr:M20 family metallopeptidase [Terriglobales bacterium]